MPSILILTKPGDVHALALKWAVGKRGWHCEILCTSDFPQQMSASLLLGSEGVSTRVFRGPALLDIDSFDVVFCRHLPAPVPWQDVFDGDWQVARKDWNEVTRSIFGVRNSDSQNGRFFINCNHQRVDHKPLQLREALRLGFLIPKTLISNDYNEIRDFIACNNNNGFGTVLKGLSLAAWTSDSRDVALYTTKVSIDDISERAVSIGPAIYQRFIDKSADIRVTSFGESHIAVRIDSQADKRSVVDFRAIGAYDVHLKHTLIDIPDDVVALLSILLKKLGLSYGCTDFALDRDGNWVYLETNPSGQFLWIEAACPEAGLLQAAAEFLSPGGSSSQDVSLRTFMTEVGDLAALASREIETHVMRELDFPRDC